MQMQYMYKEWLREGKNKIFPSRGIFLVLRELGNIKLNINTE